MSKYPTDPELRSRLQAYRSENVLTTKQLANLLDCNPTFLSKYCNDKLDHKPGDFEARARDILLALERRRSFAGELLETSLTRAIHGRINYIRKIGDIALLHSPAGLGKTSAALLYLQKHPSTIYLQLNANTRNSRKLEGAIFDAIENRSWSGNTSRFQYLLDRLKGTGRVVIIDNAQRLDYDGREWLFDFWDATGPAHLPIVLLGNPEVLDKIRGNDQQFSRIGIEKSFSLSRQETPDLARTVAAQFADDAFADEISDLVAVTAAHHGHLRAVAKQVTLAVELMSNSKRLRGDPRGAYRAAHAELVRDYRLPSD